MTDASLPEPGWYPDPAGGPDVRWWDGTTWSSATHPRPSTFPPATAVAALRPVAAQPVTAENTVTDTLVPEPAPPEPSAPRWQQDSVLPSGEDVAAYPSLFEGVDDDASRHGSRRSMWIAVGALLALLAIGVFAVAGLVSSVSGRARLDTGAIEERIAAELSGQSDADVVVTCPDSIPIAAGTTFSCTAETAEGSSTTVTVRQVDDQGNVRWHVSG